MTSKALQPVPWLRPLSWVYRFGVAARNLTIDSGMRRVHKLPVPVISIGNLSVGGTGKTPFVALLIERMHERGLRVGVLARGYGRRDGEVLNDEGRLLALRFPDLPQVQDPSRIAAGRRLLEEHDVDVILLDDGYQHRMLHRDLNVCLLDAADPFGGGLLPAGYLREPASALKRADVCVLTGAGHVSADALAQSTASLRRFIGDTPCYAICTEAVDLLQLPLAQKTPLTELKGREVSLLCGIARPQRFVQSVEACGAKVVATRFLRDHASIKMELLDACARDAVQRDAWLLVTEKDEARMRIAAGQGPQRFVFRIGQSFVDDPGLDAFLPQGLVPRGENA